MTKSSPFSAANFFIILAMLFIVTPVSAAILPPVANPNINLNGNVIFFLWNGTGESSSKINLTRPYPQLQDQKLFVGCVSSTTGEKILGEFYTDNFTSPRALAPGLSQYTIYGNTSSTSGTSTLKIITFIQYANSTKQQLFTQISQTGELTVTGVMTSTSFIQATYARRNYTYFPTGSSLMFRINATTTSASLKKIQISVAGTQTASRAEVGYWEYAEGLDIDTPPSTNNTVVMAVVAGFIGGFVAILYWRRRYRR